MKLFGTARQVIFQGKSWYSRHFLIYKSFATGNFWEQRTERFPYEVFWFCEAKQIRRKIVIHAHPFLSVTFFGTRNRGNTTWFPFEIFRYCERNQFRRKMVILAPSLISTYLYLFFDTRNQWNTERFTYETFRHCAKNNFQRKILILSPLSNL